jgi:hypothetical protein
MYIYYSSINLRLVKTVDKFFFIYNLPYDEIMIYKLVEVQC